LHGPAGLVFGPDANIYLSTAGDNVLRYSGVDGHFMGAFVDSGAGGLSSPDALVFGPDGNLYVTCEIKAEVLRYNGTTGAFLGAFVAPHSGGITSAGTLLFTPDTHSLLVTTASDATNAIYRYDELGNFTSVFVTTGSGGLDTPIFLAFGPPAPINNAVPTFADDGFDLRPIRPNPTWGGATLDFELPGAALVTLELYDLGGARRRTLIQGALAAGSHSVVWDGRDKDGRRAPPGVYYARFAIGARAAFRRFVLVW
jgi:hypothetical protein